MIEGRMRKKRFPSQALDQFLLRFPTGLRDKIGAAARANNRSMTAEMVGCLDRAYSGRTVAGEPGDIVIPGNSAAADVLFELRDQQAYVTKIVEGVAERLARLESKTASDASHRHKKQSRSA